MSEHTCINSVARGFSLVELVLVMAIIAVLFSVAAPRYHGALSRYHADAAARRVVADLHAARSAARQTSHSHTVAFDSDADQISYTLPSLDQRQSEVQVTHLAADPYMAAIVSADFSGMAQVTFDGFGMPSSGGTVVIASGGQTRSIVLEPTSGKAAIQ